ncbi:MAG: hypothetical protein JWQ27_3339 [Ferruginibacter sp.]|nr:hypothetical protein [Ferruginibacter sp.]
MTVFIRQEPLPGETLAGLIARTAAANGYRHAKDILIQCGDVAGRPASVSVRAGSYLSDLAETLGVEQHRLSLLLDDQDDASSTFNFFGQRMRLVHRSSTVRRVSPRALRISNHYRGMWGLNILTFDPVTKEILLGHCPICEQKLGFSKTQGIAFCDWCETRDERDFRVPAVDLRDFPQPLVEVEDVEALDFFTSLVAPEMQAADYRTHSLHDHLSGMKRIELFELALAIASAARANSAGARSTYRGGVRELEPVELAGVGRCLLDWPASFIGMCGAATSKASDRSTRYGLYKEVGPFADLPKDKFVVPLARSAIDEALKTFALKARSGHGIVRVGRYRSNEDYIGIKSCGKLGIDYNALKRLAGYPGIDSYREANVNRSPWYFRRSQILPVISAYKDLMSEMAVSHRLGLPQDGVQGLQSLGVLELASGPECEMTGSSRRYCRGDQVQFLQDQISEHAWKPDEHPDRTTFHNAMLLFPATARPWAVIVKMILDGKVRASFHRTPTKNLFSAVSVSGVRTHLGDIRKMAMGMPKPDVDRVPSMAIVQMLSLSKYAALEQLEHAGLLMLDEKRTASYRQVMDFASRFIMANEFAAQLGVATRDLEDEVREAIKPAFVLNVPGGLVYKRAAVMRLLNADPSKDHAASAA